jgi:shikimate dehydrogenase
MSDRSYVLGLVGEGIDRSLTPAMQEAEGRAHGLALAYRTIDASALGLGADDLAGVLTWAKRLGFDGLNVTHPFKQAVVPLLDDVSPDAHDLGAVNTVVLRDGHAVGHNTDASGYARALRTALPGVAGDNAVMVGTGGAGLAVGYALLSEGISHLSVYDVDPARSEAAAVRLAKRFGDDRVTAVDDVAAALSEADGLVNATPIGMHGHEGMPVDPSLVEARHWVSDVVYFPLETALIAHARALGCRVVPGGGMAVGQAIGAFELFTGRTADAARMTAHFLELTR